MTGFIQTSKKMDRIGLGSLVSGVELMHASVQLTVS